MTALEILGYSNYWITINYASFKETGRCLLLHLQVQHLVVNVEVVAFLNQRMTSQMVGMHISQTNNLTIESPNWKWLTSICSSSSCYMFTTAIRIIIPVHFEKLNGINNKWTFHFSTSSSFCLFNKSSLCINIDCILCYISLDMNWIDYTITPQFQAEFD